MKDEQTPQPLDAAVINPPRRNDGEARPFQVGDVLPRRMSIADMCRAFPVNGRVMDRSTFHRWERAGKFERFELKPQMGAKAWSGTLVGRYLDCEAGASRFVTVSRPALVGRG